MKIAALILTALFASGAIPTSGTAATVAAISATMLGALGYTVSRSLVKAAAVLLLILALAAPQAACSSAKGRGVAALGAAVDCELPDLAPLVAELLPIATSVVLSAVSSDGKAVDTAGLKKAWSAIKSDQGRCALATAIATIATPPAAQPGAPAAAGLVVDPGALHAAFAAVRAEHGWGPTATGAGTL